MPSPKRPSKAAPRPTPQPQPVRELACTHDRAQTVAYLGRAAFDELDVSLLWCSWCGALGSARYTDGETIRWQTPKPPPAPVPPR